MHKNHLCYDVNTNLVELGSGSRFCVSQKLPGDADTADPGTAFSVEKPFGYVLSMCLLFHVCDASSC